MTSKEAIQVLNEQRNKFMDEWVDFGGVNEAYNMAIQALKEQEAVVQKTGHWIWLQFCANEGVYCSECHTKMFDRYPMKKKLSQFCGHCGAKMDDEVEGM